MMPLGFNNWQLVGTITAENRIPLRLECTFPINVPGVYRLTFANGYIYIGEAKDLRARFRNYRAPTSGTEQEHVIRYILLDAGSATIDVITGEGFVDRKQRRKRETDEKNTALRAKVPLLNKGGLACPHYLRFKIKYHEDMLAEARAEFDALLP